MIFPLQCNALITDSMEKPIYMHNCTCKAHAMHMHFTHSHHLPEALTPAIDISDSWGEDWDLNSATE